MRKNEKPCRKSGTVSLLFGFGAGELRLGTEAYFLLCSSLRFFGMPQMKAGSTTTSSA